MEYGQTPLSVSNESVEFEPVGMRRAAEREGMIANHQFSLSLLPSLSPAELY